MENDITKAQAAEAVAERMIDCAAFQILMLPNDVLACLADYVRARAKATP